MTVTATWDGSAVRIAVSDTGPGMPDDQLPHLFDAFWRGDDRGPRPGAGLGLTIARWLVEAHGGCITAERAAGGGLTIEFTIPTARSHA